MVGLLFNIEKVRICYNFIPYIEFKKILYKEEAKTVGGGMVASETRVPWQDGGDDMISTHDSRGSNLFISKSMGPSKPKNPEEKNKQSKCRVFMRQVAARSSLPARKCSRQSSSHTRSYPHL